MAQGRKVPGSADDYVSKKANGPLTANSPDNLTGPGAFGGDPYKGSVRTAQRQLANTALKSLRKHGPLPPEFR